MTTKAEQVLLDGLSHTLKHTGGTMPMGMVLPDQETLQFVKEAAKGRKNNKLVTFRVGKTFFPSIKGS